MGPNNDIQPAVNVKDKSIIQMGFVVNDAVKMAKLYSKIFGIGPWNFIEGKVRDCILHGKTLKNIDCGLRLALADLGAMQIELIQPMYGPSTHMSFLKEHGEGIHHVSFGTIEDHDEVVSSLNARGIDIEMQGLAGNVSTFTYLASQNKLGTIFEVVNPTISRKGGRLPSWGTYNNPGEAVIDIKGKEIKQLGIVVEDVEETAKNYWELLGVGPWILVDINSSHLANLTLHGIDINDDVNAQGKIAIAQFGDIQIELIQPLKGIGSPMEFLKTRGQGIHHLSFGEIEDYDEVISRFNGIGIEAESSGLLGGTITFSYMATQRDLGTIFEVVKRDTSKENTLIPYGIYPPNQ